MRVRRWAAGVAGLAVALGGCSDDDTTTYNAETEAQFMSTCVASVGQGERPLCECIYENIAREIPFDEFEELDRRLKDDPDAELPERVDALVVDCATTTDSDTGGRATTTSTTTPP
ncbi:MAG: hypothetical protein LC808_33435 [Actinobacteria bacterium]|nr:hypothetical protein [Actinomycetota bacterium]